MAVSAGDRFAIRITRVVDGDSLEVKRRGFFSFLRSPFQVRLYAMDAPEASQPYGKRATDGLRWMVRRTGPHKLLVQTVDRYGRVVGVVYPSKRRSRLSLNVEMVRQGHAYWYQRYGGGSLGMAEAESEARSHRRGVWADGDASERPWDYRARMREAAGSNPVWAAVCLLGRGVRGLLRWFFGVLGLRRRGLKKRRS